MPKYDRLQKNVKISCYLKQLTRSVNSSNVVIKIDFLDTFYEMSIDKGI